MAEMAVFYLKIHFLKNLKYCTFWGPCINSAEKLLWYFLAFGQNTKIYRVIFGIKSEYGKMQIGKFPNTYSFHAMKID